MFSGYRCELDMSLYKWRVSGKYGYRPFKLSFNNRCQGFYNCYMIMGKILMIPRSINSKKKHKTLLVLCFFY